MRIALTQRYVVFYTEVRVYLHRGTSSLTQRYVVFTQRYVVSYAEVRGANGVGDTVLAPVLLFCQRYLLILCTLTDYG